jgi:tetratricopeptide (TPR) repeat protein
MEATLDWSYELLSGAERAAFRALSTFAGGFDLDGAEAIAGTGAEDPDGGRPARAVPSAGSDESAQILLDVLSGLVDKSLVVAERTSRGRRYRLLEPVRQYAALALVRDGESERARTRHAAYYAALAQQAAPLLRGPEQVAWLDRLDLERDNLRSALAWTVEHGTVDAGRQLAISLTGYWSARGHLGEGRRWLQTVLAAPHDPAASPALRMRLLMETGVMAKWQGDLAESRRLLTEALTSARDLADRRGEAEVLIWLSSVYWQMDEVEVGLSLGEESLRLSHEVADDAVLALAYIVFGSGRRSVRDIARAVSASEEGLRRFRALGDLRFTAMSETELGLSLLAAGDLDRAEPLIRQCVHGHRAVGEQRYVIYALLGLAELYQQKGAPRQAAMLLRAADVQRESIGMRYSPFNRATARGLYDSLRQQLTPAAFDEVYEAAAAMSLDEVLAEIDAAP